MTKIVSTPFGDYAEKEGKVMEKVDYHAFNNPSGIVTMEPAKPTYKVTIYKAYSDAFLDDVAYSAPSLSPLNTSKYKVQEVEKIETKENVFGIVPKGPYSWRGVALNFVPRGDAGEPFRMEVLRTYRDGSGTYHKSHGEIRYYHKRYCKRVTMTFDLAPLVTYLSMCEGDVRKRLLKLVKETAVFSVEGTELEPEERRVARIEAKRRQEEEKERRARAQATKDRIRRMYKIV